MWNKTGVINDPLDQTHSLANSEHCFRWNLFCFENWGRTDGRTYERTYERKTCAKNNDHYRPWLWVGLVDQQAIIGISKWFLSYYSWNFVYGVFCDVLFLRCHVITNTSHLQYTYKLLLTFWVSKYFQNTTKKTVTEQIIRKSWHVP